MNLDTKNDLVCDAHLIPSYVDGELDERSQTLLESHLEDCSKCREELRLHRLFICELDSVLNSDTQIPVPESFSRLVAVNAASDMSGVRTRKEKRRAFVFCVLLAVAGIGLLGGATRAVVFDLGRRLFGMVLSVAGVFWEAVYDSIVSLTVISRVLSRKFIIETGSLGIVLVLLAVAIVLLKRLISDYHRAGATE